MAFSIQGEFTPQRKRAKQRGLAKFLAVLAAETAHLRPEGRIDLGLWPQGQLRRLAAPPAPGAMAAGPIHGVAEMGPQRRHLAGVLLDPVGNLAKPLDLARFPLQHAVVERLDQCRRSLGRFRI